MVSNSLGSDRNPTNSFLNFLKEGENFRLVVDPINKVASMISYSIDSVSARPIDHIIFSFYQTGLSMSNIQIDMFNPFEIYYTIEPQNWNLFMTEIEDKMGYSIEELTLGMLRYV